MFFCSEVFIWGFGLPVSQIVSASSRLLSAVGRGWLDLPWEMLAIRGSRHCIFIVILEQPFVHLKSLCANSTYYKEWFIIPKKTSIQHTILVTFQSSQLA